MAGTGAATLVIDEEAALVAAVAAGDRGAALSQLYTRYEGRLYGLGCRLLGDTSLAEELVQETFVRLWRKASQYDPERGSVSTFVFTIARRIAVDLWRRPSSRPFEPEADESATGDPVEAVLVSLTVRDALDALSGPHREVLELSYRQGLKQTEIAARLGVPLGTVKTRTYHALRALKEALDRRGVSAELGVQARSRLGVQAHSRLGVQAHSQHGVQARSRPGVQPRGELGGHDG